LIVEYGKEITYYEVKNDTEYFVRPQGETKLMYGSPNRIGSFFFR
jgi:hypothetical protein